jgi:hypothetical protein
MCTYVTDLVLDPIFAVDLKHDLLAFGRSLDDTVWI